MKAKSLIRYKIGYDPDKKQKSKSAEAEEDGERQNLVIPIVAGKKEPRVYDKRTDSAIRGARDCPRLQWTGEVS